MNSTISRAVDWMRRRAENVVAALLGIMFVCFLIQIVFRYFFNFPIGWTSELSVVTWLYMTLLGSTFWLKESDEVRFDLISGSLGPTGRRVLGLGVAVAAVILFGMAMPATIKYVTFMKVESSSYLKVRLDILYSVYIVFAVAIIVRYAWAIVTLLQGKPPEEGRRHQREPGTMNPTSPLFLALVAIVGLSIIGLPVAFAMIGGSILWLFVSHRDMGTAAEQLLNGMMASQLLLAIPLFILAASFMSTGSILDRLLHFCNAIVGRFRGGLAQVNVLQAIVLASMSGSALADAAASGKLMQTMMTKDGKYPPAFAAALTCVSSVIGPIIPPSIPLVLYALISDTSVGYLFLGGVIPGLLLAAVQSGLIAAVARRRNFPVEKAVPLRELPRITWEAVPALLMPVILLGCLYSGITHADGSRGGRRRLRAAGIGPDLPQPSLEGRLRRPRRQRTRHRVDRHADRGRAGVQLRHHVGEHPEDAERGTQGLRALAAGVHARRQHPAADPGLLPRRFDDHPRDPARC